jgi:hypothetical protein
VFLVILFLGLFYVLIIFFLKRSLTSAQMLFSPFFVPIWCINEWSGVLNAVVFFFLPDYSRHIWLLHWWIICVLLLISCVYIVSEKKKKKELESVCCFLSEMWSEFGLWDPWFVFQCWFVFLTQVEFFEDQIFFCNASVFCVYLDCLTCYDLWSG